MKFLSGLLLVVACGCSSVQTRLETLGQFPAGPIIPQQEKNEIQTIEQSLRARDNDKALKLSEDFESDHPYSLKLQESRFLKAQALENLGRWSQAGDTYRTIIQYSAKTQPEIAALSNYRLSFVYEALGDDEKVLSSLLTARTQANLLPLEISQAEIPSRMAMIYSKENNPEEAQKWLLAADAGLRKTLESRRDGITPEWLAKMYYDMGSISTDQISDENVLTLLQGQRAVQKYLIHALQYDDPEWSLKAKERLEGTYQNFWQALEKEPAPSGYEPVVARKIKNEDQRKLAGPLANLLREAAMYKPGPEQISNEYQRDFFGFVEKMQEQVQSILEKSYFTPLMDRTRAPQKHKKSGKIVPSEDPNL